MGDIEEDRQSIIQNVPISERHTIAENAADDITKEAYDFMPVENFGNFLIKKMGFDEKVGIGRKQQIVRPIEFVPRNHRQGLGADPMPSFLQKQKDGKKIPKELENLVSQTGKSYNYIGDKMINKNKTIELNDKVLIIKGRHEDLYGFITKIDKEKEEYMVELKNGQIVKVDRKEVKLIIPELEKMEQENGSSQKGGESDSEANSDKSDDHSESDDSEEDSKKDKKSKKIKKGKKEKKDKKSKKDKKRKKEEDKKRLKWVEPNIRIRIISKKYKDGNYYNVKGIVSDILDSYTFTVLTPQKHTLEDLREKDIETIIPELGRKVKILRGQNKGHIATLLERNKRKNEVVVQIIDTMDTIVMTQDDISEVVA